MSVDTRNKRMSMITLATPVPAVLPHPDGTIGTQDRGMLIWQYYGLTYIIVPDFAEDDAAVFVGFEGNRAYQRFEGNSVVVERD